MRTKRLRVEHGFERADGLLLQIALAFAVQGDVIVLRFGVIELVDGDHVDLGAVTHDDARQFARRRLHGPWELPRPI